MIQVRLSIFIPTYGSLIATINFDLAARLLDVLIRAGLIVAMVMLCYQIFSPFLTLIFWALTLEVRHDQEMEIAWPA